MNNQSETSVVYAETFDVVKSAVDKMVDFIKPTYGPAGNKVIISKYAYFMIVDDGVQAARDFELKDPLENAIVRVIREAPIRTSDRAKDSTTGSLIMVQALIGAVAAKPHWTGRQVKLEIEKGLVEAKDQLRAASKKIKTKPEIRKAALIAYDNEKVADMVADLYDKLGADGQVTVEKSPTMDITSEISEGVTIDRGYLSPYMINSPERMETVFEKPLFLITDYRLTEASDILPILNKMVDAKKQNLVVIAENVEQHALSTMIINLPTVFNPQTKSNGILSSVAINAPAGEDRKIFLEDIAILLGAKVFSESKGDKLENATIDDLGKADRFIARRDESVIVRPKGKRADVSTAISMLRSAVENEKDERVKKSLELRYARFTNKIAVIKVGAPTENDQKSIKYKVENAVNAAKNALKGGVIAGGGAALAQIKTSSPILNAALKRPQLELFKNMEIDEIPGLEEGEAHNVLTGQTGDMLKVGVVDPLESIIAGLESAVSITGLLLTSHRMIVEHAKTEEKK